MASQDCEKCGISVDPEIQEKCPNCGRKIVPLSQPVWSEPMPAAPYDPGTDDTQYPPMDLPPAPGGEMLPPPPPYNGDMLPPPPPPGAEIPQPRSTNWFARFGVRIALGLLIFGGFSAWNAFNAADRDDTGAIVDEGDVAANELVVGDCLLDPGEDAFEEVHGISCDDPHDFEIFGLASVAGSSYPTDLEFDEAAFQYCLPAFEAYTGEEYDTSQLWIGYFVPDESAWSAGDRIMQCYLYLPEQTLTNSRAR
jgi:hypothetical protein